MLFEGHPEFSSFPKPAKHLAAPHGRLIQIIQYAPLFICKYMEYFTNDEIFTGKIYTFLFSRWFTGHSYGLESAKQAARKENTGASLPNEEGSMTADEKGATLLTKKKARQRTERRWPPPTTRKLSDKKKTPMPKDMEALKISVKMKIFLRRAFQDKHLLHRAFQTWQQLPDDPQDKSRRTT